jgi:WD repeat-containing protein 48
MYADELLLEEPVEFREDQRSESNFQAKLEIAYKHVLVNLGKWVLRHIFSRLIDEMIKRDEVFRKELNENIKKSGQRANAPTSIQMPSSPMASWQENSGSAATPRANGNSYPMTPGMGIGVATPAPLNHLPGVPEDGAPLDKRASQMSRASAEKTGDYFSSTPIATEAGSKPAATPSESQDSKAPKSPADADKEANGKDSSNVFGKKFRMGMSFGSKKLGRSASTNTEKPVVVEEKVEDGSETSENGEKEKEVDDSFFGVVQKIRNDYEKALQENPEQQVESGITPSLPNEAPVLKPPPLTTVIIQEETSGGSADLYRGTVATVGEDASLIEERAPMWLGEVLLRVRHQHSEEDQANEITEQNSFEGTYQGFLCAAAMARSSAKHRWPRRQFALECQQDASCEEDPSLRCRAY